MCARCHPRWFIETPAAKERAGALEQPLAPIGLTGRGSQKPLNTLTSRCFASCLAGQQLNKRNINRMNYRTLGKTGLQVSEIGYGAWGIGKGAWIGASDDESSRALHRA